MTNVSCTEETPQVLIPYTEFAPTELARQLNDIVTLNTGNLAVRGLTGVISRYSDIETAEQKVRKGQAEHAELGHFAIVNTAGDVRGSASVYPSLILKKQHVPLPPFLAPSFLTDTYPKAGPNIHAWTNGHETELLAAAYKDLVHITAGKWKQEAGPKPWTVEPTRSPQDIHEAIREGGLEKIATRRFDDGESRRRIPVRSTLYARLFSEWTTAHGKQKELKTGIKSLLTELDEEAMLRGPM